VVLIFVSRIHKFTRPYHVDGASLARFAFRCRIRTHTHLLRRDSRLVAHSHLSIIRTLKIKHTRIPPEQVCRFVFSNSDVHTTFTQTAPLNFHTRPHPIPSCALQLLACS
jgi:hypothetical protein